MIDFLAREPHFIDHLAPVWHALPESLRGRFHTHIDYFDRLRSKGIEPTRLPIPGNDTLTVAAAYRDLKLARKSGRPVVLAEHGAGQSYKGTDSGSYIGAKDRRGVVAVMVPGQDAARRHTEAHPDIPAYVIGCPKLDERHRDTRPLSQEQRETVAISFHWPASVGVQEAGTAWRHFSGALPKLNREFNLIGHAHPKMARRIKTTYLKWGIEFVPDFDEVMDRAGVYVIDNSSTLFEFASLDRPVVVLNAPWFRPHVEHGLRFWECADVGVQCWNPRELPDAIRVAMADPPEVAARRREIVRQVYGETDGNAAARAADALIEVHSKETNRDYVPLSV